MNEKEEEPFYDNLKDLAKDSTNLMFQLLRDRVLRFNLTRSLEINTFFLNYFLLQNYFVPIDLQEDYDFGRTISEDESLELSFFREYIEKLSGIFIMVPMMYKGDNFYTKTKTDDIIDRCDAYGEFTNIFFSTHENLTKKKISEILNMLEDYVISHNFLPYLDYDPEFQQILDSKATNQLFCITRPKNYIKKHDLKRYNYPVDKDIKEEFEDARHRWNENLFTFSPDLINFKNFLSYGANFIAVMDFGSKELMKEVIELFKKYYVLRIPSRKDEISKYMDLFEILFSLTKGRLFIKYSWNKLITSLQALYNDEIVDSFLNKVCLNKSHLEFPKKLEEFNSSKFIDEYNQFLNYGLYCYLGQVYTGAILTWRSMIKYLEELQYTDEFKDQKGTLLENWCLKLVEEHGFQVEKVILRNKDVEPNESYRDMKEQVQSFNKDPLEFEVEFIEHQNKYPFHEFDLIFRVEKLLYVVECKSTAIRFSEPTKFVSWTNKFERAFDIHNKKIENLAYNIERSTITHPLFQDLIEYIPIIIQTEGIYHPTFGFDTHKFRVLLANIKHHHEIGDLMKVFEES